MGLPAPFGKYELLEHLGTGGMADVFLARSFGAAGFEKHVVVKRIRPEHARDPRFVSLFIHEAKVGVHLNHPNIVQVHELGKVGEAWYIAMEHLHGRDLARVQRALRAEERRMDPDLAVRIAAEVCRGLAFAHGDPSDPARLGVVHRDVSPHNVFVTFSGDVKLVDFGIARLADEAAAATGESRAGGKLAYMSPEQARGGPVDHRTDLFSAGVVLWELLTGERLVRADDPGARLEQVLAAQVPDPRTLGVPVDDALWNVLRRALAASPADRHPDAASLEEDLRAWLHARPARPGRRTLARALRELFPDASTADPTRADLARLALDIRRLEEDASEEPLPTPAPASTASDTPTASAPPSALEPSPDERKRVAVLVVDVDGLTDLSERLEPEALFTLHLQLLRWLRRVTGEHGGTLQHVHDDQAYVFFGVPRTRSDDARRALACAQELHRRLPELREAGLRVHLAVGVHVGDVTLGHAGARLRYTARGDTTRLARRLSEQADQGEVLCSDEVRRAARTSHVFLRAAPLRGRGGRAPTPAWRLDGPRQEHQGPRRGSWLRRDRELDQLGEALAALGEERGTTVVITGEGGTGKSRLLQELSSSARHRGLPVHGGHASPFGHPLAVLRGVVLAALGLDAGASDAAIEQASTTARQLGLHAREIDALRALLGVGTHPTDASEMARAAGRLVEGLAARRPLALLLEDLHHVPEPELAALGRLVHRLREVPVLVLATSRDARAVHLLQPDHVVRLGALSEALQARLAASALGAERVDEALLALLARTCEGNPLYVEELCAYLEERGRIELEDGQARLVSDDAPRLPEGLAALLASRIDALDPASKGALQVAAVIGTEVPLDLLTEVIGVDDATPLVEDLGAHSLLRPAEGGQVWGFPSELVRQAALRSVLGVQLRDYHRLVAAALERRVGREGAEWSDEELAEHCGRAGRAVDGARYAYTAAVRLERSRELESARRWYKRGLHWLEQASDDPATYEARIQGEALLRLRLGAVTLQLGEPRAGHAALRLALEVCEEAGLPWLEVRCHLELGRHHLGEGEAALARAHLGQARALARWEEDPALDAELAEAEARLAELEGTPEEARDAWSRALACAPDAPARTRCLLGQAMAMLRAGLVEEAEASLTRAHEEARSAADRLAEGEVLSQWGVLHLWRDEPEEAVRALRRALQLRLETGDRHGIVVDHHAIGDVHLLRGDLVRAALAFRRSRERAEAIGWRRGVVLNEVFLAFLEDPAPGSGRLERLEAATEDARRHGMPEVALSGEWLSGRLLAEAGRVEEARGRLTGARTRAERQRLAPLTRAIGHSLAELPDAHA